VKGKQTRVSHLFKGECATSPLDTVHMDTVGELPHPAVTGERYLVTIVDGFTKYVEAKAVYLKADITGLVKHVHNEWENQFGPKVKSDRTDRGDTEFVNNDFEIFFAEKGILHEKSAPYTPEQNGLNERINRTL
jgi:transposase InsO family protein